MRDSHAERRSAGTAHEPAKARGQQPLRDRVIEHRELGGSLRVERAQARNPITGSTTGAGAHRWVLYPKPTKGWPAATNSVTSRERAMTQSKSPVFIVSATRTAI